MEGTWLKLIRNHRPEEVKENGLSLISLIDFFAGHEWTTKLLAILPIKTSSGLTAEDVEVVPHSPGNVEDIESISFRVGATNPDSESCLEWTLQVALETQADSPNIVLSDLMVIIEWPASFSRSLRGTYCGSFNGHPITGEFTPDFFQGATVYKTTFLNSYSMVDLLAAFFTEGFCYSEQLNRIRVPGLRVLEHFATDTPSHASSFVVKGTKYKNYLTQVSSGFPFTRSDLGSHWGILMNQSLSVNSLRVVLSVINSPEDYQVAFELGGQVDKIPFHLVAGLSGLKTHFELAIQPIGHEASISRLLELTGSSDILHVTGSFPDISNLSNELAVSNASLGWVGHDVNSLGLGVNVNDWKIVDQKFEVRNLSLSIQSTSPFHAHKFFLWGSGIVKICGVPLHVTLKVSFPFISFRVSTLGQPLTLNSIFHHLEVDGLVLPYGFTSILDQTGISSTIIEGSHVNGWSLSQLVMTMSVNDQLDIFEHFKLSFPSLVVNITSPFNKVMHLEFKPALMQSSRQK
ncbi:hypothetical protein BJV78DRAFT_661555 [Lactifluus subvellereus]|nr:hypothetical protein BJV78DRAFT_661555 [Lactifluus subvellereus]